jgi:hypothetical protein
MQMGLIPSFVELSTGALLLASCVQIALLTLLVGRSRRRRQARYVALPQLQLPQDEDEPNPIPVQPPDVQARAAWKGEMLRRFDSGGR